MSFSEKLQSLRKESKLSQEQLADMLDVTRQSVSKWESGQTYPEMDKLLGMCKIFKCSLDDLTNDDVKEIRIEDKKRTNISNFIDSSLDFIKRTYDMFKTMRSKEIVQCLFTMFIVACVLLLFRIPVDSLESAFVSIVDNFNNGTLTSIVSGIFCLLLDACYFVLFLLIFFYIFKIGYLDRYEYVEVDKETSSEKKVSKEENSNKKPVIKNENNHSYTVFNTLGIIAMFFIKIMICVFAFPFVVSLFMLSAGLVITIVLLFKGLFYFGILLGFIFSIMLNIFILEIVLNFLFNRKNSPKRLLITFLVSIAGLGISFGIVMLEVSSITFVDLAPELEQETVSKEFDMTDELYFHTYDNIEYVVDNSLGNNVKVDATYYKDYGEVIFEVVGAGYNLSNAPDEFNSKELLNMVVENLAKDKIYNYNAISQLTIKITASEENIAKLKQNFLNYQEKLYEQASEEEYEYYDQQIVDYENTIDDLQEENENLKTQNEECQSKITEYKDTVSSLLND